MRRQLNRLGCFLDSRAISAFPSARRRSRTFSPACQTLPAPSVSTRSPSAAAASSASTPRSSVPTYSTPRWPNWRMRSTSDSAVTPSIGFSRGGIDIHHEHAIRLVEGARELVHQVKSACVTVRLEQHVNAPEPAQAGAIQSSADFRGVMSVIIHHGDAALLAAHLEAPVHAAEGGQRLRGWRRA